ncbi:MAG TPA: prepilin-type N-terminal cleavage/methylation domain-containing protein [Phycisphaerae bacterium]|nr:prepilin-type N-terminal cleavage/methylation domain-containing protein [Phycisphaerae bacterium]HNU44339.1 prepilin-type N-terminal cleavage/methylation domain-containing protein [Phycisphaerae bacterium]
MARVRTRQAGTFDAAAFSLVELVMVVVIIGIIAAIAVPRISRASTSARASKLQNDLEVVRDAIDRYYAEHGRFPGSQPATGQPKGSEFVNQLLLFSDEAGNTSETYGYPCIYGPYLRKPFPANPCNDLRTVHVKPTPTDLNPVGGVGWIAVLSNGAFGIAAEDAELELLGLSVGARAQAVGGIEELGMGALPEP